MGDVVVVGSINVDLVAFAERHPGPGETVPPANAVAGRPAAANSNSFVFVVLIVPVNGLLLLP